MKAAELRNYIRNTHAFIESNPYTVVLMRKPAPVSDGEGGFTTARTATPVEGQRIRVIPQTTGFLRKAIEGEELQTTHVLLGMPDFDVVRGDYFVYQNSTVEVTFRYPDNEYEVRVEAAARG